MFFGIGWPQHWGELIVFVLAGVVCFAALGVAFAHVIPNFESTAAYVNAVFLPVVFSLVLRLRLHAARPASCATIAEALPLEPLIDGLSGAMVSGASLGDNLDALAVIALWGAFGLYFAVRGFSWESRRDVSERRDTRGHPGGRNEGARRGPLPAGWLAAVTRSTCTSSGDVLIDAATRQAERRILRQLAGTDA